MSDDPSGIVDSPHIAISDLSTHYTDTLLILIIREIRNIVLGGLAQNDVYLRSILENGVVAQLVRASVRKVG